MQQQHQDKIVLLLSLSEQLLIVYVNVHPARYTDSMLCSVRTHLAVVRQAQLVWARVWAPLRAGANLIGASIRVDSLPPVPGRPLASAA